MVMTVYAGLMLADMNWHKQASAADTSADKDPVTAADDENTNTSDATVNASFGAIAIHDVNESADVIASADSYGVADPPSITIDAPMSLTEDLTSGDNITAPPSITVDAPVVSISDDNTSTDNSTAPPSITFDAPASSTSSSDAQASASSSDDATADTITDANAEDDTSADAATDTFADVSLSANGVAAGSSIEWLLIFNIRYYCLSF